MIIQRVMFPTRMLHYLGKCGHGFREKSSARNSYEAVLGQAWEAISFNCRKVRGHSTDVIKNELVPCQMWGQVKIFSHSIDFYYISLTLSFALQNLFISGGPIY